MVPTLLLLTTTPDSDSDTHFRTAGQGGSRAAAQRGPPILNRKSSQGGAVCLFGGYVGDELL